MKEIISTDKAPAAIGPYSQAVRTGNLLFTSGMIPIDPATNQLVEGDIEVQAHQAIEGCSDRDRSSSRDRIGSWQKRSIMFPIMMGAALF